MLVRVALVTPAPVVLNTRGQEAAHILVLGVRDIQGREGLNTLGLVAVHTQAPEAPHTLVPAVGLTPGREGLVMTGLADLVTQALAVVHILVQAVAVVAQECVGNSSQPSPNTALQWTLRDKAAQRP
jgi:hypothetical protein